MCLSVVFSMFASVCVFCVSVCVCLCVFDCVILSVFVCGFARF